MSTQIVFTQGHISIRRGRVTRQYANPTLSSFHRLCELTSPRDYDVTYLCDDAIYTNRSTIYTWHGWSSLSDDQKALVRSYRTHTAHIDMNSSDRLDDYDWGYVLAWQDALRSLDIHPFHVHP